MSFLEKKVYGEGNKRIYNKSLHGLLKFLCIKKRKVHKKLLKKNFQNMLLGFVKLSTNSTNSKSVKKCIPIVGFKGNWEKKDVENFYISWKKKILEKKKIFFFKNDYRLFKYKVENFNIWRMFHEILIYLNNLNKLVTIK
nr:hypothetical protein 1634Bnrm1_p160 [Cryptomonas sp.]